MAELTVTSKTESSIVVELSGLDSTYTAQRYYYWYIKEATESDYIYDGDDESYGKKTSVTYAFTGLDPGTTYDIRCAVQYWENNGNGAEAYARFTIQETTNEPQKERPDDWEWETVVEQGKPIELTAQEWNNFTERINEFRVYLDMLEINDFTTARRGRTKISASIVNEAQNAIAEMTNSRYLPDEVGPDDPITAAFFNGLMKALNDID